MKKIAVFLFVLFITLSAAAQKTVTFKVAYKPNTVYTQNMTQTASNTISYKASEEILGMLEAQGVTNPTITENKTTSVSVTTTGKLTGTEIPLVTKMSLDAGTPEKIIPDNTMLFGRVKQDGLPVFDSIQAPGMNPQLKEIFIKTTQATLAQIIMPEQKVKVGQTFNLNIPLNIPVGPAMMNINDTAVYKLIKVEGTKAYFDVNHTYTIDTDVNGQPIKGSGTGTGKVVHDLANNYILKQDITMTMQMGFDTNGITMDIKSGTVITMDCTISAAK